MDGRWIEDCKLLVLDKLREREYHRNESHKEHLRLETERQLGVEDFHRVVTHCLFEKWLVAEFVAYPGCVSPDVLGKSNRSVANSLLFVQTERSRL